MLTWDDPDERYYEHGLDRGVLYIPGLTPIPWNGLTGFEEGTEAAASSVLYRDGLIYLADFDPTDFSGRITAKSYPEEFGKALGIPQAADGFFVDNQKPSRFSMSYRTLVGSGTEGDMFGYQIHLVYNAVAAIGTRARKTIGSTVDPVEFAFEVVCTPVKLTGYRPSAHYIIDTRNLDEATVAELEALIYDGSTIPTVASLYDIMNFGAAIMVTNQVASKGFKVEAASSNISTVSSTGQITLYNINASAVNPDGSYTISTGGNTTVVDG